MKLNDRSSNLHFRWMTSSVCIGSSAEYLKAWLMFLSCLRRFISVLWCSDLFDAVLSKLFYLNLMVVETSLQNVKAEGTALVSQAENAASSKRVCGHSLFLWYVGRSWLSFDLNNNKIHKKLKWRYLVDLFWGILGGILSLSHRKKEH